MKLIYIANLRLPTEKAYGIQIAKMCEAFAALKFKNQNAKFKITDQNSKLLEDENIEVELIAPTRRNHIKEDIFDYYGIKRNFKFTRVWTPDFYLPGFLDKLAVAVKSLFSALVLTVGQAANRRDWFYSRDESPLYFLSFFARPEQMIFEAHKFSPNRKWWYRRFVKKGIKVVVISRALHEDFLKFGFKAEKILLVPDGVDLTEFDISVSKSEARRKLGLPLKQATVVYTGHLYQWKGVELIAETAKMLKEVLFVLVGGTDRDIANFKSRFGGIANLKIIGHRPYRQIPLFLKAADVLILANVPGQPLSERYTSPLKLFEYMASKRPIVASDLPSIREILNDKNAVLVQPTADSIAEGLKKVFSDQNLSDRISNQAFSDVQKFSWQNRTRQILEFINRRG